MQRLIPEACGRLGSASDAVWRSNRSHVLSVIGLCDCYSGVFIVRAVSLWGAYARIRIVWVERSATAKG
jgi:hypothetical protein